MTVICNWCGGKFVGAGPGPQWPHDTEACVRVIVPKMRAALVAIAELGDPKTDTASLIAHQALGLPDVQ